MNEQTTQTTKKPKIMRKTTRETVSEEEVKCIAGQKQTNKEHSTTCCSQSLNTLLQQHRTVAVPSTQSEHRTA